MRCSKRRLPALLLTAIAATAACAVAPEDAPWPSDLPLEEGLARLGRVRAIHPVSEPPGTVVLIRDRHVLGGTITRVPAAQREIHRIHRTLLERLAGAGFALAGCEYPEGPLARTGEAARHFERVERAIEEGERLDALSFYQPVRWAVELAGRMEFVGVEDPDLYGKDVEDLDRVLEARRGLTTFGQRETPEARRERRLSLRRDEEDALRRIRANVDERGRRAARNLLEAMAARGVSKAVLIQGAAHIPAAADVLAGQGLRVFVFEAPAAALR